MKRLLVALAAVVLMAGASDPAERLPDPAEEARARALFKEVRCLVCQNESIDDSEADLARDLRALIREQIRAGKTDDEIIGFLKARYGEFVLLTPAVSAANAVLWGAPFLVLALGATILIMRRRRASEDAELSEQEQADIADLMNPRDR